MLEGVSSIAVSCELLGTMKKIGVPVTADDLSKRTKYSTEQIGQYLKDMEMSRLVERDQKNNTYVISKSIEPLFHFPLRKFSIF
jgi:DNA-binding IclR family transcriptional regulator